MADQTFNDQLTQLRAGKVQAAADAAQRNIDDYYAIQARLEHRAMVWAGGNNQNNTQWQRGIEIERMTENMVPKPEPDQHPILFEGPQEDLLGGEAGEVSTTYFVAPEWK